MKTKNEKTIRGTVDRPILISLPANLTTGFSWEMDFCDPSVECKKLPYLRHRGGLGAGGIQRFEVKVPEAGEFVIRFQLKRPWESKARKVREYRIIVK